MNKGLNANSEINISVQFLLKAMVMVALVVGSYYQAMLRFSNIEVRINDMHEELVVLSSKVANMEQDHVEELEETISEQKNLLHSYYRVRKNVKLASSYSYECKECTIKRIIKKRKENKTYPEWTYPDW